MFHVKHWNVGYDGGTPRIQSSAILKERSAHNIKVSYQYDGVNFEKSNVSSVTLDGNDLILSFRTGGKIVLDFNKTKNLKTIEKEKN
jgi:hypothetical protein